MALRLKRSGRPGLPEVGRADLEQVVTGVRTAPTTFVLFDEGDEQSRFAAAALAEAQATHGDRIRVWRAQAADYTDYFAAMTARKRAFDSYNFRLRPVIGVYRNGRLVTTLHLRSLFQKPAQQAREARSQLEIFIDKLVDFDPEQVREQTNLEVAQEDRKGGGKG